VMLKECAAKIRRLILRDGRSIRPLSREVFWVLGQNASLAQEDLMREIAEPALKEIAL